MLFNKPEFAVFLLVVLVAYYCLTWRWQNVLLLAASYLFYGWWDWRFCSLLLFSTILDYSVGWHLPRVATYRRKILLVISLAGNLGVLGFFKYYGFFLESFLDLCDLFGIEANVHAMKVILPMGISFYTFQTMSYSIDIYRGKLEPTRNFVTFALFVSFFPQLVAGPIERATRLLPQLSGPRTVTRDLLSSGLWLILIGLFKKIALADTIAPLVDDAFSRASTASGAHLLLGLYLFSLQIYFDFSGYSSIARGTAKLLGIELMVNFKQPYLSQSISEFWRRWHISLSTWLRDYLYIPLGGNRKGRLMTYRNLMITMVLGGLWHGAGWHFLIWGALHGTYLCLHRFYCGPEREAPALSFERPLTSAAFLVRAILVFHLVSLTWVFFRAPSLEISGVYLLGIFSLRHAPEGAGLAIVAMTALYFFIALVLDLGQYRSKCESEMFRRLPWFVRGCAGAAMILFILVAGSTDELPFIYFQF